MSIVVIAGHTITTVVLAGKLVTAISKVSPKDTTAKLAMTADILIAEPVVVRYITVKTKSIYRLAIVIRYIITKVSLRNKTAAIHKVLLLLPIISVNS